MRKPKVIYYVDREGISSKIHTLWRNDPTDYDDPEFNYSHGINYIESKFSYFTRRSEAVKVMRAYLRNQIAILKDKLKNLK